MKLNTVKQKLNAAIEHVKNNPVPYAVGLALAASAAAQFVYDKKMGAVHMEAVAKEMAETGKGMYFRNPKTGVTIIAALYDPETMKDLNFLD